MQIQNYTLLAAKAHVLKQLMINHEMLQGSGSLQNDILMQHAICCFSYYTVLSLHVIYCMIKSQKV